MMFLSHIAFSLELLALAAGIYLLVQSMQNKGPGSGLNKVFGIIITVVAIIMLLNTLTETIRVWRLRGMIGANMMMQQQQMRVKNMKTSAADQAPGTAVANDNNNNSSTPAASQNT